LKRTAVMILLAAVASAATPSFAAETLGRLFFTPAQRAQLDTARSQKSRASLSTDEEAAPLPETVTYSGMVRRNDGKSTVWLNNRAVNDRQPVDGVPVVGRVRPDGRIVLDTPQGGPRVELKVGQSVEIVSGTIEEPYSRRLTAPKSESKPAPAARPAPADQGSSSAAPADASAPAGAVGERKSR
jgi:hypothetical protein